MSRQTKIIKKNILSDAVNVTMRDLMMKDILTKSEIGKNCKTGKDINELDIYIDYHENTKKVTFKLSINGEPASKRVDEFEMFLITGNNNQSGRDPFRVNGEIDLNTGSEDSIVSFPLPKEGVDVPVIFSEHKNGYSYMNYVIYGIILEKIYAEQMDSKLNERIMLGKGKIYRTDVLTDLTENVIDGQ